MTLPLARQIVLSKYECLLTKEARRIVFEDSRRISLQEGKVDEDHIKFAYQDKFEEISSQQNNLVKKQPNISLKQTK